jgi:hypothetical protein
MLVSDDYLKYRVVRKARTAMRNGQVTWEDDLCAL